MNWKEFMKINWKYIILFTLLILIIPNFIKFLGSYINDILFPKDYTKFNFLEIEFGGPPFWVMALSTISLLATVIFMTVYLLKKKMEYKNIYKIVLVSAILFSIISFIQFLITIQFSTIRLFAAEGEPSYFSSMFSTLSFDFVKGVIDILSFIFYRLIYTPLFYVVIPSLIVIGIDNVRKRKSNLSQ